MATTHTVVKGDTLWGIAERYLGSGTKYTQLAAINNIPNPNLIYIGQVIKLSGSGGSSSTSANSNAVTIRQFGVSSTDDKTIFATWTWGKESQTESYKIVWSYTTLDGVEFSDISSNSVDEDYYAASRQTTYTIPDNALKVTFRVKPISKKYTKNDKETTYWNANWSTIKTHTVSTPLSTPKAPTLSVDGLKLTAELDNLDTVATGVQFRLIKDNTIVVETTKTININTTTGYVSYVWSAVSPGCKYTVECRAVKGSLYSDWSDPSTSVSTIPDVPSGITTCKAIDDTTVYLEWSAVSAATGYTIEYTNNKDYFDTSSETTEITTKEGTGYYVTNIESGKEYFFRVRAVNDAGESDWTDIVSIIIGKEPAAPTTWSSTTTAVVGEMVNLYWVHNAEDGSSQTYAQLELAIGSTDPVILDIANSTDEEEKDKTSVYSIDTSSYDEGTTIRWRVRTAGITLVYGDWSIERVVNVYAQPTLQLSVTDSQDNPLSVIAEFPFYIYALPGPKTQTPIGYHLSVISNEIYETVDRVGNTVTVNQGQEVYSKYFNTNYDLAVEMSAGNIDLETNISYTITCVVTMDSGLNAETSVVVTVDWAETMFIPNAAIGIDEDTYIAYIQPYCDDRIMTYRRVAYSDATGEYTTTNTTIDYAWGEPVSGARTTTDERVYSGVDGDGNELYFCQVMEIATVDNVVLSVYRREFDGTFTEIATGLDNSKSVTVTDPHPALDYARYRVVAISTETGAVGYYDIPGYPVGGKAVIIQWNEEWTSFETTEEGAQAQPPWSGSLLKLPYNIDVQDSHQKDTSLVSYVGRSHPVSYYGTHLGESSTWNVTIAKSDKETLYALRRLAIWMGDVYVREPSGSGYWANISVSFSQKHDDLTIPVTLAITRVEGGV